ncbi:hypothetical protein [Pseudomonas aeruginosa]|uniref:hypothetical protein n=1 Tax=Pseudomonas aeruginosa TaxID=287 RepID=UPI001FC909C2|nr:hypothetical protein [Pseudomonas aeruginosa]
MNKALVEQAGGDERAAFELFVRKHCGMPAHIAVNWDAKFTNDAWEGWKARAALEPSPAQTQPSPAPTLRAAIDVANDRFEVPVAKWGTDLVGEEERPEVAEVAFVLRNIGAMDAEDIDGDNVDLRFEDAEGRDTGCDVSIVEYAEKAADLFEQHDRIVGELRAVITQLHQHKNDYMDAGQETYRALQNEIREREAEIARLDGLVSVRTAERDAALARVAELERQQPVAWMHDQPNRVDVIHRDVKDLLQRVPGSSRGIYRPLDVSEHYTIPLYAAPVAQAQHSVPEISGIGRDAEHPRAVVLYLRNEPSDEDMRAIQNFLRAMPAAAPAKAQHSVPDVCDGKEQNAFEDWASKEGMNMERHPLHWLFLDAKTYSARQGWKAALKYACNMLAAAPGNSAQHSVPEGWKLVPIEPLLNMMSDKDHDTRITAERQLLSILADAPVNLVPQAWLDVQAERRRQNTAEGWTPEHDDLYCAAELPRAAAAYILNGANDEAPAIWPFSAKWWKPRDARSNYVRAGALILAEIERLDRARQGGRS